MSLLLRRRAVLLAARPPVPDFAVDALHVLGLGWEDGDRIWPTERPTWPAWVGSGGLSRPGSSTGAAIFRTNKTPNGAPAFNFDGDEHLEGLPALDIRAGTELLVIRADNTSGLMTGIHRRTGSDGDDLWFMRLGSSFDARVGFDSSLVTLGAGDTSWHVIALRGDGGTFTYFVSGVGSASESNAESGTPSERRLGRSTTATAIQLVGDVAQYQFFNRALTDDEVTRAMAAAASRYGF